MENNLPKGWIETLLKDIYEVVKDKGDPNIIPYLEIGNVEINTKEYILTDKPSVKGCIKAKKNDVLVSRVRPTRGAITIIQENDLLVSSAFTVLRNSYGLNKKYLFYYLAHNASFLNYLGENCTGTMYPTVGESFIVNYNIPLAPFLEQQRIVEKLDALMARINNCKARLEKIPALLKNFRQSVLAAAVSGELTKEWREENEIFEEWKEDTLSAVLPKGGIFDGPFGSNLKTSDYVDKGVRVIRLENIEHLYFVTEKETYITEEKYQTLTRHTVGEGDIIFSSFIADEIRACILPKLSTKAIAKADCFCIRPDEKKIDKMFLLFSLVSSNSYQQLVMNVHGATRPRINTTQLKELIIKIPKLKEQQEIVRKVEELFHFADSIEARYQKAKAWFDKLPQSLLSKAFRGELVAQDENDEPASELLKRIQQQTHTITKTHKTTALKSRKKYKINEDEELRMVAEG